MYKVSKLCFDKRVSQESVFIAILRMESSFINIFYFLHIFINTFIFSNPKSYFHCKPGVFNFQKDLGSI